MRRLIPTFVAIVLAPLASAAARAAEAMPVGDIVAGRTYALEQCSECHRVVPVTDGSLTMLRSSDFEMIANAKGKTATSLNAFLVTPHATMPNLIIPDADRANVIAYILSLRVR